jgi:micrococcal nuclease
MAQSRFVTLAAALAVGGGCDRCCYVEVEAPCLAPQEVTVTEVVDGDTFDVEPALVLPDGREVDRVRLLCTDTPELDDHACYAEEATERLSDLILGREVTLHFAERCLDDHSRVLAYVLLDGRLVNLVLAEEGYGLLIEDWFAENPCCDEIEAAVEEARAAGEGGWSACAGAPWVP